MKKYFNELPSLRARLQELTNKHHLVFHVLASGTIMAYIPETMETIPENTMFGCDVTNLFRIMPYMYKDDIDYARPYIYPTKGKVKCK